MGTTERHHRLQLSGAVSVVAFAVLGPRSTGRLVAAGAAPAHLPATA